MVGYTSQMPGLTCGHQAWAPWVGKVAGPANSIPMLGISRSTEFPRESKPTFHWQHFPSKQVPPRPSVFTLLAFAFLFPSSYVFKYYLKKRRKEIAKFSLFGDNFYYFIFAYSFTFVEKGSF